MQSGNPDCKNLGKNYQINTDQIHNILWGKQSFNFSILLYKNFPHSNVKIVILV